MLRHPYSGRAVCPPGGFDDADLENHRVNPHTTDMAPLRSAVDINTIRVWLGHVSLHTTDIDAESDLQMKAQALARCEALLLEEGKSPSHPKGLMGFLRIL